MKPVYLEFCGINSFSERTVIDFAALTEFGIFGIFGDTGSGKSTILDCIGFALYGAAPRSRTGSVADLINYRADRAYVRFEFEIVFEGARHAYRIDREIKRKNALQSAKLYEKKGDALLALKEGVRDCKLAIEEIVGLEQKDFEKCIALPQGEFAQFVRSPRADRLKLVARLFELEAYGERLVKRTNARCAERAEAYRLALARMQPYEYATEEALANLRREAQALRTDERAKREEVSSLRAKEKEMQAQLSQKREAEAVAASLAGLEKGEREIVSLEQELTRLERAADVIAAYDRLQAAKEERTRAEEALSAAQRENAAAELAKKEADAWDAEGADEEIARCTARCARAGQAKEALAKAEEYEKKLTEARRRYAEELDALPVFDYEKERGSLLAELEALGEDDLITFAERECKQALLRTEYADFAEKLYEILKEYPETDPLVSPMHAQYAALSQGEQMAFAQIRAAYEEQKKRRRELNNALVLLEKRNADYRNRRERLQKYQTDGKQFREELNAWRARSEGYSLESAAGEERRLEQLKQERRTRQRTREAAQKRGAEAAAALAAAQERYHAARRAEEQAEAQKRQAAGSFSSREEAQQLILRYGDAKEARERIRAFREEQTALRSRAKQLAEVQAFPIDEEQVNACTRLLQEGEAQLESLVRAYALKQEELRRTEEDAKKRSAEEAECARCKREAELYERMKKLFDGNKFMDFVAEEYLQNVAETASARLLSLTDGRYFLRYEGGANGFYVGDNFNGGQTRGVYTLSGGETFLVSLSLALALSSEICRRSLRPIEFFFLDEGFGTLDSKLVGVVMDSLEKLRNEHFSIGVISHVEELKHRIERKLLVEKATEQHGSKIIME